LRDYRQVKRIKILYWKGGDVAKVTYYFKHDAHARHDPKMKMLN